MSKILLPHEQVQVDSLHALSKIKGALQVITNECAHKGPCEKFDLPRTHPRHFVIHDVTRLEGPNDRGQYIAHTKQGDYCMGQPDALLRRLTEAGRAG
jgi:hypothetical protein